MKRHVIVWAAALLLCPTVASAADLVRGVRYKLSAGDLPSGIAAVDEYRREHGADAEYWNAVGWLARGAAMLDRPDLAAAYVRQLRDAIPEESEDLLIPFGARIEVETKLILTEQGRGAALRFLEGELARAKDPALRSRIYKNVNLISLEGTTAPPIDHSDFVAVRGKPLRESRGRPVLLYLFAQWCGDCKAQSEPLARVWKRYRDRGLELVALTRYYGTVDGEEATTSVEKARVEQAWKEAYEGLADVPVTIDSEAMIRYGASATPTFVFIDREGKVRFYAPTRLSEDELSRRIEELFAE